MPLKSEPRRLTPWVASAMALIGAGYLAYVVLLKEPEWDWGYRLTVTLSVDGKDISGSTVVRVHAQMQPHWLWHMGNPINCSAKGGAVYVDLGQSKNLILSYPYADASPCYLLAEQFGIEMGNWSSSDDKADKIKFMDAVVGVHGGMHLDPKTVDLMVSNDPKSRLWPSAVWRLVTFTNLNNPDSLTRLDPKNLGAVLGGVVTLKSVYVEATDAPAEYEILEHLPWLRTIDRGHWERQIRTQNDQDDGFTTSSFFQGNVK